MPRGLADNGAVIHAMKEKTHMENLPPYTTPRWVKYLGIMVLVLVLVAAIVFVTGIGGPHGPGRHTMPSGGAGGASVARGVGQPRS